MSNASSAPVACSLSAVAANSTKQIKTGRYIVQTILVCGSHSLTAEERIWAERSVDETLREEAIGHGTEINIFHGGAYGVDQIAARVAHTLQVVSICEFPAQWHLWGKRAGFIRNSRMIDMLLNHKKAGHDVLVLAFFPKGVVTPGTAHTVAVAQRHNIPVRIVSPRGVLPSSPDPLTAAN